MSKDAPAISEFWTWFREHDAQLRAIPDADDPFWDTVLSRLQRIHPGLRFEMSDPIDGQREWVITVQGDAALFPLVDATIAAAPALNRWTFVALKPAMGFDFVTTCEGVAFDPKAMLFLPLESASRPADLGLRIGIAALPDHDRRAAASAAQIILNTGLGERAAAGDVQHVEVAALPSEPEKAGYIGLPELPAYIAWRKRRLART